MSTTTIYTSDLSSDEIKQLVSDAAGTLDLRQSVIEIMPINLFNSISTGVDQIWLPNLEGVDVQDGVFDGLDTVHIIVQTQEDGQRVLKAGFDSMLTVGDVETAMLPTPPVVTLEPGQVQAAVVGDPYIFPVDGPPVKLPNVCATYRLFQHRVRGVYVDAVVKHMDIGDHLKGVEDIGWAHPVRAGYYITSIMVRTRDTCTTVNIHDDACLSRTDLPWTSRAVHTGATGTDSTELGGIFHGVYQSRVLDIAGVAHVEIRIFDNKQIMNGLVWSIPRRTDGNVDGLLYRNYRPKFFVCNQKTVGFIRLPKHTHRLLVRRSIVGHGEVTESVLDPLYFKRLYCA